MSRSRYIVTPQWLEENLSRTDVKVIDASWYLPAMERNGSREYLAHHIPGAKHFDIDAISDKSSNLPHMLPSPEFFAPSVSELGISNTDTIVVYDGLGLFSAARVWWMFRIFGANKVFILDGGFPAWTAMNAAIETGDHETAPGEFVASLDDSLVASRDTVHEALDNVDYLILDARPAARFSGEAKEPRAGVRSGHMPGARNLPVSDLISDGRLKPEMELKSIFSDLQVKDSQKIITSCGSGVTAAIITLALNSCDYENHVLYDGSWSEWGTREDSKIVTG
ncbi:MAG: 3-mercaptopyruvate sulfurtransferase [Cohaesibacteraceae bacterium]|nr:3-mercaptopyruvate sulfurtransferase [Cohaesibacteraceae bacterium]